MLAGQVTNDYIAICIAEQIMRSRLAARDRIAAELQPLLAVAAALGLREAAIELVASAERPAYLAEQVAGLASCLETACPDLADALATLESDLAAPLVEELARRRRARLRAGRSPAGRASGPDPSIWALGEPGAQPHQLASEGSGQPSAVSHRRPGVGGRPSPLGSAAWSVRARPSSDQPGPAPAR